jgi:hypothetical protein
VPLHEGLVPVLSRLVYRITLVANPHVGPFSCRPRAYQAVCFTGFLVGFITVLCIGNYFRAKRAQERQRQRRLTKLANRDRGGGSRAGASVESPPRSGYSEAGQGSYAPPTGVHA